MKPSILFAGGVPIIPVVCSVRVCWRTFQRQLKTSVSKRRRRLGTRVGGKGRTGPASGNMGGGGYRPSGLGPSSSAKGLCSPQGLSLSEKPGPGAARTTQLDSPLHRPRATQPRAVFTPAAEVCPLDMYLLLSKEGGIPSGHKEASRAGQPRAEQAARPCGRRTFAYLISVQGRRGRVRAAGSLGCGAGAEARWSLPAVMRN